MEVVLGIFDKDYTQYFVWDIEEGLRHIGKQVTLNDGRSGILRGVNPMDLKEPFIVELDDHSKVHSVGVIIDPKDLVNLPRDIKCPHCFQVNNIPEEVISKLEPTTILCKYCGKLIGAGVMGVSALLSALNPDNI